MEAAPLPVLTWGHKAGGTSTSTWPYLDTPTSTWSHLGVQEDRRKDRGEGCRGRGVGWLQAVGYCCVGLSGSAAGSVRVLVVNIGCQNRLLAIHAPLLLGCSPQPPSGSSSPALRKTGGGNRNERRFQDRVIAVSKTYKQFTIIRSIYEDAAGRFCLGGLSR